MNDEYREATSESEWSSRDAGTGTATAEPVDRRWFEEALRAQGFLVEPPAAGDDPMWKDTAASAPPDSAEALSGGAAAVEAETTPETDDLAIAEAEAIIEADEPFSADAELRPVTADVDTVRAPLPPEPWDVPAGAPTALTADADAAPTSAATVAPTWAAVEPTAEPGASWSRVGTTPARLAPTPVVDPVGEPIVPAVRQAVQPATLPPNVSPVPTAALAARLARTSPSAATVAPAPVQPEASVQPASIAATAPTVASTPTTSAAATADVWTLPALKADLAAEQVHEAAPTQDAQSQPVSAAASVVADPDVAAPAAIAVKPVLTPPIAATTAPAQSAAPFSPPTAGIADVARRPAGPTLATTVDGGDSDLWGLVGDPTKPSAAVGAAAKGRRFSATSILLHIFVAIVLVALVLGFAVLLTSLF